MATNVVAKNGKTGQSTLLDEIKVLVLGEPKCGKTRFIEAFALRQGNVPGEVSSMQFARVYKCQYEILSVPKSLKIFKIFCACDEFLDFIAEMHIDFNALIFMYAIDDPSSLEEIKQKWISKLRDSGRWIEQPAILVGNKKDLREDEQVIQRLARDNQAPVTRQQGESLIGDNLRKYYECSSIDENDKDIHDAFHFILGLGYEQWRKDFEALNNAFPHLNSANQQGNA